MISSVRSRGVCQSCRNELQSLFERSFCSTATSTRLRPESVRPSSYTKFSRRDRSSTIRTLSISHRRSLAPENEDNNHELATEDAALASQIAAIELLEKELGRPLEQAIEEDVVSAELLARYKNTLEVSGGQDLDSPPSDPVATLRDAGASAADVVREARQIHGDVLPEGTLVDEELALYRRLYGEPMKESMHDDMVEDPSNDQTVQQNQLYSAQGDEIDFQQDDGDAGTEHRQTGIVNSGRATEISTEQAISLADSLGGAVVEEDEYDDNEEDEEASGIERAHPLTNMGKFRTNPKTIFLPQDGFIRPVEAIMSNFSNKHLKEVCERTFGGPGLPDSPLTPRSGRSRQQIPVPLDVGQNTMSEMEANAFISAVMPPTYASIMSVLVETRKRLGSTWLSNVLAREGGPRVLDAGAGGVGIVAWREIVQAHWDALHAPDQAATVPPTTKSVVLTGSDGLRHRSAAMLENTTFIPRLPDYVHTRSVPTLEDDRPSQKRKQFDVIIAPHALFNLKEDWMRKQYVQNLWTMLGDEGGVLILIEKGVPRGFEAIAGAREMLLERFIRVPEGLTTHYVRSHIQQVDEEAIHKKETAMIVAPCTNHEKCPMYTVPGLSRGRKDVCSFQQRYQRPQFLQRVLGAKDRNHDDVDFSYLSVMKGDDLRSRDISSWKHVLDPLSAPIHANSVELSQARQSLVNESNEGFEHLTPRMDGDLEASDSDSFFEQLPTALDMPRIVYPPLKRRGHVSMDLCTSSGKIERWTIPRSFSKQAYRDARKSKWGDLWALGAKTQIPRNLRVGTPEKDLLGKNGEVIPGKGRSRKERLKIKAMQMLEQREEEKMNDLIEQRDLMEALDEELEADAGTPRDVLPEDEAPVQIKTLNNRERKAARRATRGTKSSSRASMDGTGDADLTFKPRSQSPMDDIAVEHAMSEWQAEFGKAAKTDKGGRRGFGSSSKAAKTMQKWKGRNESM